MKRKVIIHRECEFTQLTLFAMQQRAEEVDRKIEMLRPKTISASKRVRKKARRKIAELRRDLRRYNYSEWKYLISLGLVEFVD